MKLYHIHKRGIGDDKWVTGNRFLADFENQFWKSCMNFSTWVNAYDEKAYPYQNVYKHYKSLGDIPLCMELLDVSSNIIGEFQMLIREVCMENIRNMCFSNLPSRCSRVWLCRENQIDYWKKFIPSDVAIFEVEVCERRMFKSRNLLIPLPSDSYAKILEKAKVYWSYQSSDENEDDEYLYNGEVLVIRQV